MATRTALLAVLLPALLACPHPALAQSAVPAPSRVERPSVPLPRQPFTLELLDLKRGEWLFRDAFGGSLDLPGAVTGWAWPGEAGPLRVAYLTCDPEYPENPAHADLRPATTDPATGAFCVDEPWFSARITLGPEINGMVRCTLSQVHFGPARPGDRYTAALYVMAGDRACPVHLAAQDGPSVRLATGKVGNVFTGDGPVRLAATGLGGLPAGTELDIEASDAVTGTVAWRGRATIPRGAPGTATITLAIARWGIFGVTARAPGIAPAHIRICRIPAPRLIPAARSGIGINLFQQQVWWYAHQAPLMAAAGVHWIRPWLAWENTWALQQPFPGVWETRPLDASLRRMDRMRMRYASILFAAPQWLTGTPDWNAPPPDRMAVWETYVEALARRYRGRIPAWEMWNEPDLMWPEATRHQGEHYVDLLKRGYAAVRRGDPAARVLGLSHAGYMEWLEKVGKLGAGRYMDIATLHTYADPDSFLRQVEIRREAMRRNGMGKVPIWMNEFGATANDFTPAYSAKYGCSERRQAEILVANYAQALSVGPGTRAFWFCTLDPRDPVHEDQWTGDAGIGILYLGLLPKLAYAALAGVAQQLDGRECHGAAELLPGVRVVSFAGPVAVAWAEKRSGITTLPAAALGCLATESVVVRDLLGNVIARGPAAQVRLDFRMGPLYLSGSRQLDAVVRAGAAVRVNVDSVRLDPGASTVLQVAAPARSSLRVRVSPTGSVSVATRRSATGWTLSLRALGRERSHGALEIVVGLPAGACGLVRARDEARTVPVTVGAANRVRDGGFVRGDTSEWTPERTSPCTYDRTDGHDAPGCMKLEGPFDRRMVHWNVDVVTGRPMHLSAWVKSSRLGSARVTISLALFGEKGWIRTWCLASTQPGQDVDATWRAVPGCAAIPAASTGWTRLEAVLPGDLLPAEVKRAALFVDASGGAGVLRLDDVDLW